MSNVQKVEVVNKRPNHILHLLLSLVTFGLWVPVWIAVTGTANLKQTEWNSNEGFTRVIVGGLVFLGLLYLALK